jgi:multidrug transporter EmrE-like cation transporter
MAIGHVGGSIAIGLAFGLWSGIGVFLLVLAILATLSERRQWR